MNDNSLNSVKPWFRALLLFLLLVLFPSARAQTTLFQSFAQRDGLAADFVTAIAFEPSGAAWIGTTRGATRIHQQYWTTYTAANGLGNSWVNGIAIAPDGKIYFATYGGGLTVFDGPTHRTFTISNSAIPSNYLTTLALDRLNRVWVGTFGAGIARLEGEQWTRYRLADNFVNALALDANNNPWVATNAGAFYFNGAAWTRFTRESGLASSRVNTVAVAPDGRVWFGTEDGATVFDPTFRTYRAREGLVDDSVRAFAFDARNRVWLGTARGVSVLDGARWQTYARADGLADNLVTALSVDRTGGAWVGTSHGLSVEGLRLQKPATYPVVLIHGWHGPESDHIDDSEFRFLRRYLERDGFRVFYAEGILPTRTLHQNAATLRDVITDVRKQTGSAKVDLIAFSMGGLNARAYLESSLYQNDVRRALILGTPMAGVRLWYPLLTREIENRPREPSTIELTPEYAWLFNRAHTPRVTVPYDLLAGDARDQFGAGLLRIFPPSDGLIEAWSAHELDAPNVRRATDSDLHAWNPSPQYFEPTSFLYPEQTYERYIRNALRDPDARPLGRPAPRNEPIQPRNITPMHADTLRPGEVITRTIVVDANRAARFFARWDAGDVNLELRAPDGTRYTFANYRDATYLKASVANFIGYAIPRAAVGVWEVIASRADKSQVPLKLTTYADLDADLRLQVASDQTWYRLGATGTVSALLSDRAGGAEVRASVQWLGDGVSPRGGVSTFNFNETTPGNYQLKIPSLDRGGYYLVRVTARGAGFARERQLVFSVSPETARLEGTPTASVEGTPGNYTALIIETEVSAARAGDFALAATLKTSSGEVVMGVNTPIALKAGTQKVNITIPGRDIRAREVDAPYTLDLVLMDVHWAAVLLDAREGILTITAYRARDFGD